MYRWTIFYFADVMENDSGRHLEEKCVQQNGPIAVEFCRLFIAGL